MFVRPDAWDVPLWVTATAMKDEAITSVAYMAMFSEFERPATQVKRELQQLTHFDSLTGLGESGPLALLEPGAEPGTCRRRTLPLAVLYIDPSTGSRRSTMSLGRCHSD